MKPIIQIAIGTFHMGDVTQPVMFALTEEGEVFCYENYRKGKDACWVQVPPIPDDEQGTEPELKS